MRKEEFRAWLAQRHTINATNNRVSRANRVEKSLSVLGLSYPALDEAYDEDQLASVLASLRQVVLRASKGIRPPAPLVKDSTRPAKQIRSLMNSIEKYREFREYSSATSSLTHQLPSGRVWITSFWGFSPENEGFFGFTRAGDRKAFIDQWRPGDLVMVYATLGSSLEPDERGRVLGFLEIEPKLIDAAARLSPDGNRWRAENRVSDRWKYAVPVVRAWRCIDGPAAREIAPITLGPAAQWRLIASRGLFLRASEAKAALSIPVRPAEVYGGPSIPVEESTRTYTPSRGFPMWFGRRSFETIDGPHSLYVLQMEGDISGLLHTSAGALRNKVIVKVGLAKDPKQRCAQHNASIPPACNLIWKILYRSAELPDGDAALTAEDALKKNFASIYRSLGGEFFLCDRRTLRGEFERAHGLNVIDQR
jgi:hypothetical protein